MYLAFSAMAARSDIAPARWRKPFLIWMDGVEAGWAIPLLLIGFIAVWLAFLVIAYIGGDLHSDVLGTWTLGRRFEWGYSKHPPLMDGWRAHGHRCFRSPTGRFSDGVGQCGIRVVDRRSDFAPLRQGRQESDRAAALDAAADLSVSRPALQCQRGSAGDLPLATYCFLRSFENREIRWAIAAGAAGALRCWANTIRCF